MRTHIKNKGRIITTRSTTTIESTTFYIKKKHLNAIIDSRLEKMGINPRNHETL